MSSHSKRKNRDRLRLKKTVHSHTPDVERTSDSTSSESDMDESNVTVAKRILSDSDNDGNIRAAKLSKSDNSEAHLSSDDKHAAQVSAGISESATWSECAPVDDASVRLSDRPMNIDYRGRPMYVYIEGITTDIARYVKGHLKAALAEIDEYMGRDGHIPAKQWFFQGKFIRITCDNLQQVHKLLAVKILGCHNVKITLPRAVTNDRPLPLKQKKSYIVFGIDEEMPLDDILADNRCTGKILQSKDGTYSALFTPIDDVDLPFITIAGCLRRRTNIFYPRPLQCLQCWAYGHSRQSCGNRVACQHCGFRGHSKNDCRGLAQGKPPRCINCKGQHAADDRKCPRFIENKEIKRICVDSDLAFPAAKVAWQSKNKTADAEADKNGDTMGKSSSSRSWPSLPTPAVNPNMEKNLLRSIQRMVENLNLVNHYLLTLMFRIPTAFDYAEVVNINAIVHNEISQNHELLKSFAMESDRLFVDIEKSFANMHEYQDNCLNDSMAYPEDAEPEEMDTITVAPVEITATSSVETVAKKTSDKHKIKNRKSSRTVISQSPRLHCQKLKPWLKPPTPPQR